jgi:hypothetical protein
MKTGYTWVVGRQCELDAYHLLSAAYQGCGVVIPLFDINPDPKTHRGPTGASGKQLVTLCDLTVHTFNNASLACKVGRDIVNFEIKYKQIAPWYQMEGAYGEHRHGVDRALLDDYVAQDAVILIHEQQEPIGVYAIGEQERNLGHHPHEEGGLWLAVPAARVAGREGQWVSASCWPARTKRNMGMQCWPRHIMRPVTMGKPEEFVWTTIPK